MTKKQADKILEKTDWMICNIIYKRIFSGDIKDAFYIEEQMVAISRGFSD